jgi:hypothetical protein
MQHASLPQQSTRTPHKPRAESQMKSSSFHEKFLQEFTEDAGKSK